MTTEFLPPDPYADAPARRPVFVPPNAALPAPARRRRAGRATVALGLGSGALGVLVFSAGSLFFLTLPASIAGWVLGVQARRRGERPDQANVAVVIGVIGAVLSVVAGVIWILVLTQTDWTTTHTVGGGRNDDNGVRFDVVRFLATALV